jgi:hypothetical protein
MKLGAVHIDSPAEHLIAADSIVFEGWVALPNAQSSFTFRLNGQDVRILLAEHRPDVAETHAGHVCRSWRAFVDVSVLVDDNGVLVADLFIDGQIVHRTYYRCQRKGLSRPLVYFMHIAKTGGTSIRASLERRSSSVRMLQVYEEGLVEPIQYMGVSDNAMKDYDLVYGHFYYGLHRGKSRPYRYVTMLRDPFEVIASTYFFNKYEQSHPKFVGMKSIFEALEDPSLFASFDNILVRCIAGVEDGSKPVDAADLSTAIVNLRTDFDIVCFTHEMERTAAKFSAYFGVPLQHRRDNVTRSSAERVALNWGEFKAAAKAYTRWDLELYSAAQRMFEGAGSGDLQRPEHPRTSDQPQDSENVNRHNPFPQLKSWVAPARPS